MSLSTWYGKVLVWKYDELKSLEGIIVDDDGDESVFGSNEFFGTKSMWLRFCPYNSISDLFINPYCFSLGSSKYSSNGLSLDNIVSWGDFEEINGWRNRLIKSAIELFGLYKCLMVILYDNILNFQRFCYFN